MAAIVLFGMLFILFVVGRLLPVDPVIVIVGDHAPQAIYDSTYRALHFDRSIGEQFVLYVTQTLSGDLGKSTTTGNPVIVDIAQFFPATFELSTLAILLGTGLGVPMGLISANFSGRWPDHICRLLALCGYSMPGFWLGLLGLLVFYAKLRWVGGPGQLDLSYQYIIPHRTGLITIDTLLAGNYAAFLNAMSHLTLPACLLAIVCMGDIARMSRGFALWQLRQEFVDVARIKGLSNRAILLRHVLPTIAGPLVAVIVWNYAYLLEGAVLTESVFAWPGLGLYLTQSLFAADIPAVLAGALFAALLFILLNAAGELAQRLLDPRMRAR